MIIITIKDIKIQTSYQRSERERGRESESQDMCLFEYLFVTTSTTASSTIVYYYFIL